MILGFLLLFQLSPLCNDLSSSFLPGARMLDYLLIYGPGYLALPGVRAARIPPKGP